MHCENDVDVLNLGGWKEHRRRTNPFGSRLENAGAQASARSQAVPALCGTTFNRPPSKPGCRAQGGVTYAGSPNGTGKTGGVHTGQALCELERTNTLSPVVLAASPMREDLFLGRGFKISTSFHQEIHP
jgi:hypothetical protein